MNDHIFYAKPADAFVKHRTDAPVIAVKYMERGFYPIYTAATPDELNDGKFTKEEIASAIAASIVGWYVPAAVPARQAIDKIEMAVAHQRERQSP